MRLRLSRTAWLILVIGVLVIALGSLYMVYSRQSSEQQELAASLATAQARLPKVIADREASEAELAQWQDKLAEATSLLAKSEAQFPGSAESIEYDEVLYEIADSCDLEVMSLTASEPSEKKVEDVTYTVTTFEVEVRGEVDDILDFISDIATREYFTGATVELVNIKVPEPPEEDEEAEPPTATITLVGYSYKGK
jgi:Tfp pilus assembly protein PilO